MRQSAIGSTFALLGAAALAACSVINSFDDVVEATDAGTGGASGSGGAGGSAGSATGGAAGSTGGAAGSTGGAAGSTGGAAGSTGGAAGSTGGTGGATGGAGGTGGSPTSAGLIVYSGDKCLNPPICNPVESHLVVLEPTDGSTIKDTKETIQTLAYEPSKDRFFVFKSKTGSFDRVDLEVRTFDKAAAAWTTVTTVPNLPAVASGTAVAMLRDRVVYIGTTISGSVTTRSIEVLDTSSASTVAHLSPIAIPELGDTTKQVIDLAGIPGNGATFGHVNVLFQSVSTGTPTLCQSSPCDVQIKYIQVTASPGTNGALDTVGQFEGRARIAAIQPTSQLVVVFPPPGSPQKVEIHRLDITPDGSGTRPTIGSSPNPVQTQSTVAQFGGVVVDDCTGYVFFNETAASSSKLYLYGEAGTPTTSIGMNRQGEPLYYEPYTQSVIAPYSIGGNKEIWAYSVTEGPTKLTRRTNFNAPIDIQPRAFAIRRPSSFACQ